MATVDDKAAAFSLIVMPPRVTDGDASLRWHDGGGLASGSPDRAADDDAAAFSLIVVPAKAGIWGRPV